jgi:23S rRNA (cytosine1962-C5)-methyltransferase
VTEGTPETLEEIIEWRLKKAFNIRRENGEDAIEGYRLIYADCDGMPGLIADVYNDTTVLQSTSIGWDKNIGMVAQKLVENGVSEKVFLKNDQRARKITGLKTEKRFLKGGPPSQTIIREGKVSIKVDYENGNKTGFYLDQRPARLRIGNMRLDGYGVLDLFSYTGAFSLQALRAGAEQAILVEESLNAVDIARENLSLNGFEDKGTIIRGRVEKFLDELVAKRRHFDLVIADPPAFIPTPEYRERGVRAYYRLYSNAVKVVKPRGYIYASSCSFHLSREELLGILAKAARSHGFTMRVLFEHSPVNAFPYTRLQDNELRYLKGFLVRME